MVKQVHFPFHHTASTLRCFLDELFDDVIVEGQEGHGDGMDYEHTGEEQQDEGQADAEIEAAKPEAAEGEAVAEGAEAEAPKQEAEGEDGHSSHPPQEEEEPLSTTFIINQVGLPQLELARTHRLKFGSRDRNLFAALLWVARPFPRNFFWGLASDS